MLKSVKRAAGRVKGKTRHIREQYLIRHEKGRKAELSIADLLNLYSRNGELLRCDIAVRYLAVKEYHEGSDRGFDLYRKMQDKRRGDGYSETAVKQFRELIDSYDKNGYDRESRILLDRKLGLIDGSHRIALAIYYGYRNISALIVDTDHPVPYSIDWFVANGFTEEETEWIAEAGRELVRNAAVPFSCVIWAPAAPMADRIIRDLKLFGTVQDVRRYHYEQTEYRNIVRAIYAIDDIEKWKIEKKLEYMDRYGTDIVAVDLLIDDPAYRIKGKTGLPLSTVGERVKKALRTKYRAEISDYYFDIILHIGDNMYQGEYMRNVLAPQVDMPELVGIFNKYRYVLVKTDVPYMPPEFPERIPVGKDADVICAAEDAPELIREVTEACGRYRDYNRIVINEAHGTRIRLQWGKALIYQIDISWQIPGMDDAFTEEMVASARPRGGYMIPGAKYEYVYRAYAYLKRKGKTHHLAYLKNHREDCDPELLKRTCGCTAEELLQD